MTTPLLAQLKQLEATLQAHPGTSYRRKKWESLFGQIGLALCEPHRDYCDESPPNLLTFAETGGESVHFGWVCEQQTPSDDTPVAICLPDVGITEIIAPTFREFLAIGCEHGWGHLEQLAYDREACLRAYQSKPPPEDWLWPQKANILQALRRELGISWRPLREPCPLPR